MTARTALRRIAQIPLISLLLDVIAGCSPNSDDDAARIFGTLAAAAFVAVLSLLFIFRKPIVYFLIDRAA